MRKFICSVIISLLCSTVFAQRIAVIDFNAGAGISQAEVDGISAIFNTYFSPQGYTLVERMRIDRVIDEQQFQRGKLTQQQMVRIGQILNISQIVVGDVNIVMNQYNIDVRVLNVQSGTIAAKDGATWSQGSSYRTMMQQLATRLASQIAIKPNTVVSSSSQTNSSVPKGVVVLHGYLKVYPEDLGQFDSYPQNIVEQINKNAEYGYDTWRLPTKEEMQLIQANKGKIGGLTSANYMTSNTRYTKGTVRLVTDGATKSAAYQAYKLCSTIDDYRNFVQQYPAGTYTEMAKEKIKNLEDQAYKLCSTIDDYRSFVQQYPAGTYTEMAKEKIKYLEDQAYKLCSTIDDYRNFVQQYPAGTYTEMAKEKIKYLEDQAYFNGHGYVDLGLPSGTKWATCNVGANSPEEYGYYYAWGETSTKSSYTENNSRTSEVNLGEIAGVPGYDPARAAWGSGWRLPTAQELQELVDRCVWERTSLDGMAGYKVTGPNGNSIFLPAAGFRYESSLRYVGEDGRYWSSTPYESNTRYAYGLRFDIGIYDVDWVLRYGGHSVRPVTDK